jgi:anti-anti-sigma factor
MDVLHSRIGAIHLIQLRGRLDATQVDGLSERLMPMLDDPEHRMVVSLAELTGITSIGLRLMFLLARTSMDQGGQFVLCDLQGVVREVFEISGFLDILPIMTSRDAAIEQLSD